MKQLPTVTGSNAYSGMYEHFVKVISAYDEALNPAESIKYNLTIQYASDGFSFSLFDTVKSQFQSIESVEMENKGDPKSGLEQFGKFITSHPWLNNKFNKTSILVETNRNTMVPAVLFNKDDVNSLAGFNFIVHDNESINFNFLKSADAYLLFPIQKNVEQLLSGLFHNYSVTSHVSTLIEVILRLTKNLSPEKRIFVNVRRGFIDVVLTEGKRLLFYNCFSYQSKEDFIYFIIYVIEQLNLNPEEIELTFSGIIDKKSTLYDIAWKYVRKIRFQELTSFFNYSYIYRDIPAHYFFTLLNSELCES